jgi:hypothetical protein
MLNSESYRLCMVYTDTDEHVIILDTALRTHIKVQRLVQYGFTTLTPHTAAQSCTFFNCCYTREQVISGDSHA